MKSPFPGMDPYLENPEGWQDFHAQFLVELRHALAERVSPDFFVRVQERVYVTEPDFTRRSLYIPDVSVVENPRSSRESLASYGTITAPTIFEPFFEPEIKYRYLQIFDTASREVITTVELLSPINKRRGSSGYDDFWKKRREIFESQVHWIEIDVLRAGERPFRRAAESDYYALLKRGGQWDKIEVWLFNLRDKMPTIAVPLRPPFDDVPLDLQAAFNVTYERAYYADSIDYTTTPPEPALNQQDTEWVREHVRAWLNVREEVASRLKSE